MARTDEEAQRIALAEKMLSDHASEVMTDGVLHIGNHCEMLIESVHITFRPAAMRGPEPLAHCVITAAQLSSRSGETVRKN